MAVENMTSIRAEIDQIVYSITPFDPLEKEQQNFVRNWLHTAPEIFRIEKPATPDIHLVSYFALISPAEQKILLVDHINAQLWLPPGGHVELNENPKDTVKREIIEELGIEADFLLESPLFVTISKTLPVGGHTDISLWYVLNGSSQVKLEFDRSEFKSIHWFGIDEIPCQESDPHMSRFIQKLKKYSLL